MDNCNDEPALDKLVGDLQRMAIAFSGRSDMNMSSHLTSYRLRDSEHHLKMNDKRRRLPASSRSLDEASDKENRPSQPPARTTTTSSLFDEDEQIDLYVDPLLNILGIDEEKYEEEMQFHSMSKNHRQDSAGKYSEKWFEQKTNEICNNKRKMFHHSASFETPSSLEMIAASSPTMNKLIFESTSTPATISSSTSGGTDGWKTVSLDQHASPPKSCSSFENNPQKKSKPMSWEDHLVARLDEFETPFRSDVTDHGWDHLPARATELATSFCEEEEREYDDEDEKFDMRADLNSKFMAAESWTTRFCSRNIVGVLGLGSEGQRALKSMSCQTSKGTITKEGKYKYDDDADTPDESFTFLRNGTADTTDGRMNQASRLAQSSESWWVPSYEDYIVRAVHDLKSLWIS